MDLTRSHLERLSAMITRHSGLVFTEARWPFLRNQAREVMAKEGFTCGSRWTDEVEASAGEPGTVYAALEEALQIHETSFFRYERHHRVLEEIVIPEMVRNRMAEGEPRIRIWSVGCSTGEEPYSIAMTVSESMQNRASCPVEIVAVDTSRKELALASQGTYSPASAASIPRGYLAKYFDQGPEGYTIVPMLKEMVRFLHYDIRAGLYVGKFDLIFCCNVLLYFTTVVRRQILIRLAESLRRGGFLFLGHADGITPPAEMFESRHLLPAAFVYRRI